MSKKKSTNKSKPKEDDDEELDEEEDDDIVLEDEDENEDDEDDEEVDVEGDVQDEDEEDNEDEEFEELDDDEENLNKNNTRLTSRQRDLKKGGNNSISLAPIPDLFNKASNDKKELSEEKLQRKHELAQQRRIKKITETEAEMRDVVNQLLNRKEKVETKEVVVKPTKRELLLKNMGDVIQFHDDGEAELKTLSYPESYYEGKNDFLQPQTQPPAPKQIKCSAPGCNNPKRYSCPSNGKPVCTMECWKLVNST